MADLMASYVANNSGEVLWTDLRMFRVPYRILFFQTFLDVFTVNCSVNAPLDKTKKKKPYCVRVLPMPATFQSNF